MISIDDWLDFEVTDDGQGIPEQQRENIFMPFFRLDKSRSKSTGGLGLGLTLVKTIADLHGGQIQLRPSAKGGTTMVLRLRAASAKAKAE